MIIRKITLEEYNDFFKKDPKLCYLGLPDQSLDYLYHTGSVIIGERSVMYGLYDEAQLICCVQLDPWTEIATVCHFYLSTDYREKKRFRRINEMLINYLLEHEQYKKYIVYVPSACKHVIRTAKALGWDYIGTLTNCYIWRQEVVDLLIYSEDFK